MKKKPNILIFVMDTQRVDNLGCYGYDKQTTPNIDKIAEEGTVFLNNITPAVWTLPSHASLFTGLYQYTHGAGVFHDYLSSSHSTIAETLNLMGYRTVGFFANMWASQSNKGFREFFLVHERSSEDPKGSLHRIRHAIKWIEENYTGSTPFFMFIQCMEPHLPCWPPSPFRERFLMKGVREEEAIKVNQDPNLVRSGKVRMKDRDWAIIASLYDGETATLDSRIGILYEHLKQKDILDDTLFIITSDHGDMHGEHYYLGNHHQLMGHHLCVYEELIHVPLIVRYPEKFPPGKRVENLTQTLDIFPTISEILGIEVKDLQGYSLLSSLTERPKRNFTLTEYQKSLLMADRNMNVDPDFDFRVFNRWLKAYREGKYKYIWASDGRDELYDLEKDPKEKENLASLMPQKVKEMKDKLERLLSSLPKGEYKGEIRHPRKVENMRRLKVWEMY